MVDKLRTRSAIDNVYVSPSWKADSALETRDRTRSMVVKDINGASRITIQAFPQIYWEWRPIPTLYSSTLREKSVDICEKVQSKDQRQTVKVTYFLW